MYHDQEVLTALNANLTKNVFFAHEGTKSRSHLAFQVLFQVYCVRGRKNYFFHFCLITFDLVKYGVIS